MAVLSEVYVFEVLEIRSCSRQKRLTCGLRLGVKFFLGVVQVLEHLLSLTVCRPLRRETSVRWSITTAQNVTIESGERKILSRRGLLEVNNGVITDG